jgi:triacylglycerol lipase
MQLKLNRGFDFTVDASTNDGVVPTLSQLHGRVLHVARADHLDVVGHYTLAAEGTADWLPSGAGFRSDAFESLWNAVAAAIARGRQPARAG